MKIKKHFYYGVLTITVATLFYSCSKKDPEALAENNSGSKRKSTSSISAVSTTIYKGLTITISNNYAIGTILRPTTGGESAYDYSPFLMKDGNYMRLFHGGRFRDAVSDGDHIFQRKVLATTGGNISAWTAASAMVEPTLNPPSTGDHPRPLWRQWEDTGYDPKIWDSGNYLEPECIKVGGLEHLYAQFEIRPGDFIDTPATEVAGPTAADRIRLQTSTNGINYNKVLPGGVSRGNVINLPAADRRSLKLTHQEMIYEGNKAKPWVMYVFWIKNGVAQGHVRMRSADPDTFDWNDRKACSGMAQLGNQIGYGDVPKTGGGTTRLYFRITYVTSSSGQTVPSFQFSTDGLIWSFGSTALEFIGHPTLNNYFLALSTVDGTGQLELDSPTNPNKFAMLYATSASTSATAPGIFGSDIWLGKTHLGVSGTLTP